MPVAIGAVGVSAGSSGQDSVPTMLPTRPKKAARTNNETPSPQSDQPPPTKCPKFESALTAQQKFNTTPLEAELTKQRVRERMLRTQQIILQRQKELARQEQQMAIATATDERSEARQRAGPPTAAPRSVAASESMQHSPQATVSSEGSTPTLLDGLTQLDFSVLKSRMKRAGVPQRLQDEVTNSCQPRQLAANLILRYETRTSEKLLDPQPTAATANTAPVIAAAASVPAVVRSGTRGETLGQRHQEIQLSAGGVCLCTLCFTGLSGHNAWPHPLLRVAVCERHFEELCDAVDKATASKTIPLQACCYLAVSGWQV